MKRIIFSDVNERYGFDYFYLRTFFFQQQSVTVQPPTENVLFEHPKKNFRY